MSLVMSLTMTAVNVGFSPYFFTAWIKGFAVGSLVSIPTSLIVGPTVQKAVK